jgi:hypothetical protein
VKKGNVSYADEVMILVRTGDVFREIERLADHSSAAGTDTEYTSQRLKEIAEDIAELRIGAGI